MRSQAFSDPSKSQYLNSQKVMEINPRHPLIVELNSKVESDPDSEETKDIAWLLHDTALLQSGFMQVSRAVYSTRLNSTHSSSPLHLAYPSSLDPTHSYVYIAHPYSPSLPLPTLTHRHSPSLTTPHDAG